MLVGKYLRANQSLHAQVSIRTQGKVANRTAARFPTQDDEVSMSPKKDTQKSAKSSSAAHKTSRGFTDEERAAMKERAKELTAEARRSQRADQADGESEVLATIAE